MNRMIFDDSATQFPLSKTRMAEMQASLIQRLQNIKQHYIKYFIQKYEKNVDNVEIEERKDLVNSSNNNGYGYINGFNRELSEINLNNSKENDYIYNNL